MKDHSKIQVEYIEYILKSKIFKILGSKIPLFPKGLSNLKNLKFK